MATIIKRTWMSRASTGHKVRHVAWSYSVLIKGKQERCFSADWTREDAENALAARLLERTPRQRRRPPPPRRIPSAR